jgi:hypothetical protein
LLCDGVGMVTRVILRTYSVADRSWAWWSGFQCVGANKLVERTSFSGYHHLRGKNFRQRNVLVRISATVYT